MEPEGSLPCSHEPFTSPYPEPAQSYLSKIHFNIIHPHIHMHTYIKYQNICLFIPQFLLNDMSLTLSCCMSIFNRRGDSASKDECLYMIDIVSSALLWSYVDHTSLLTIVFCANAFMNVLSAFFCHLEVII
jgi:hypothetical protein